MLEQKMIFQNYIIWLFLQTTFYFYKTFNNEIVYIVQDRVDE